MQMQSQQVGINQGEIASQIYHLFERIELASSDKANRDMSEIFEGFFRKARIHYAARVDA